MNPLKNLLRCNWYQLYLPLAIAVHTASSPHGINSHQVKRILVLLLVLNLYYQLNDYYDTVKCVLSSRTVFFNIVSIFCINLVFVN